ncbi:hypothetical protein MSAN_00502000 [Mycena sanguinolenta]|uniref:DUF6589 domain-containing protein n=1 Tax=Mycena sanguinolenta TaxID=230812 RepID=A0A8H6Z970_9AGAR|nr:hypothetical protein MSAN_00502000 [Mycena sanguinolenta]
MLPFYPYPQRQMIDAETQTESELDVGTQLALNFGANLFDGIIPETALGGRQRKQFKWPDGLNIRPEDRLLVVIRAIKTAGFTTLGAFLAQAFCNNTIYNRHPTVYQTISSFLQAKERSAAHHPVAIGDLIFRHRKSQEFVSGIAIEPHFLLPQYSLPPSIRTCPIAPISSPNTTYNALVNWSLHRMIERFEKETKELLEPQHGFLHRRKDPALTWEGLLVWSLSQSQETIALHAPAIFTLFTTIAVNQNTRKILGAKVAEMAEGLDDHDITLDDALPFAEQYQEPAISDPPDPDESDGEDDSVTFSDDTTEAPAFMAQIARRDPWQAITVFILVLLSFRNRFALILPILIGLFAFTCNANRELISVLCRLGLSVSYKMVLAQLHVLGADSAAQLRLLGAFDEATGPAFLILFDNVNKMKRAWRAALGHKDEVKSGTASTIIGLVGVQPGAFLSEPLNRAIAEKKRAGLSVKQLKDDIDWDHIRGVGIGLVLRVWLKHIPALAPHHAAVEELFKSKHKKHILQLRKSDIRSTRLTNIDESTTVGAAAVLFNVIIGQLAVIPTTLYRWLVMICGDQLSIDLIRKLKDYTKKFNTPFTRHEWALPIIQLWHLKWNWQKAIFRLHWHPKLGKDIFGLHHDCELLERGKFNHEKCDFYPAHHILEDRFETVVLDALRLVCEQETDVFYGAQVKLTDLVSHYFDNNGPLYQCSFERLETFATTVYRRYMCTSAAEDAKGHSSTRNTDIYGAAWSAPDASSEDEEPADPMPSLTAIGTKPPPRKKKKKSRAKAGAQPERNFSGGDQVIVNLVHFMRVTFWYLELCAGIAEGDIGRVFEVIKLLRFSFWGAGSTNYGNELLELACNFLYEWSDPLRLTVLENYLVNPTGQIGHWLELDLLQEHFNFWIKALFNSKSHDFDGKHLSEAVGLNITGISKLRERFPGLFGLKRNGQKHRKNTVLDDINRLGAHFRQNHILEWESGRNQPYVVGDEFAEGIHVLSSGTLKAFLARTTSGGDVQLESLDTDDSDEDLEQPPCPATVIDGVMDVDEFISGVPTA